MRYGIFSDVHSNLDALQAVVKAYKKEAIDAYLCVGDVVGYAANPIECIDEVRRLTKVTIAGNHDRASIDLLSSNYFNPVAAGAIAWTKEHLDNKAKAFLQTLKFVYSDEDLTLVHGTLASPEDFSYMVDYYSARETFSLLKTPACFIGHTHVAGLFIKAEDDTIYYRSLGRINIEGSRRYIINVGSVGQPRDSNPHAAYGIYDTKTKVVEIKRVAYDIEVTRKKIADAGLSRFLGDRLLVGR